MGDVWSQFSNNMTALFHLSKSTPLNLTKSHPLNLYHQCRETPLKVFIDCIVDHNLNSLIKYGKPAECQLRFAWDELYQEYCDMSGGSSYKTLVSLANDIATLDRKITQIKICLRVISLTESQTCVNILRKHGYKYNFDRKNETEFRADLDRVANKSKVIEIVMNQKILQRDSLIRMIPNNGEITREYFDRVLIDLWKYQGTRLDENTITVSEYCHIKRNYEKEIEYMNNQAQSYKKK
jgi:hypothetical protein